MLQRRDGNLNPRDALSLWALELGLCSPVMEGAMMVPRVHMVPYLSREAASKQTAECGESGARKDPIEL